MNAMRQKPVWRRRAWNIKPDAKQHIVFVQVEAMIVRFVRDAECECHRRICCFTGHYTLTREKFLAGRELTATTVSMEHPKRNSTLTLIHWNAAKAKRNPNLAVTIYEETGTLHPDQISAVAGDIIVIEPEDTT
jgi:hypothetical protein